MEVRTVVDIKSETKAMLSLMNVVIKERDTKADKKRDIKFKSKKQMWNEESNKKKILPESQKISDVLRDKDLLL